MNKESLMCPNLTYMPDPKYNWDVEVNSTKIASNNQTNMLNVISEVNSFSEASSGFLYLIVLLFLLFTVTMSAVYVYHWWKFNLNDPFIKNFTSVYFLVLVTILIPLIFNLLK